MKLLPLTRRLYRALIAITAIIVSAMRAWITLEPAHWSRVANHLQLVTEALPCSARLQLLQGQVLRSARRPLEAAEACRRALAIQPKWSSALVELGRCQRQASLRADAIATWREAALLGCGRARLELCRYAAREALPEREPGVFARTDYASFIAANPVGSPPDMRPAAVFCIAGDDHARAMASQTYGGWFVAGGEPSTEFATLPLYELTFPVEAVLDRQCLAWLNHAVSISGSAIVRADHDHVDLQTGRRQDPVFLPQPDFLWSEGEGTIARLEAVRLRPDIPMFGERGEPAQLSAFHVPLVLLSLPAQSSEHAKARLPDTEPGGISVIIPTRDNPEMLAVALESLLRTAARPDLVDVIIVDNGRRTPEGMARANPLRNSGSARIVPFDEPFNWSRASNIGAAAARHNVLLFLNDDTEMHTASWDRIVAGLLEKPNIGVVGARMVYPDGSIQHSGFVFGMDNGPQHEGRWMDCADSGPGGRWTAIRPAVAVTGAFMAVRQHDFTALGGFDEQTFKIDFADVDFCLRTRAAGMNVCYCGVITLLHHESVSRGLNLSRSKRRRMRQEWRNFRTRWGHAALNDPGYPPVWSRKGASYDGMRAPV